jgi:hypothetical protein
MKQLERWRVYGSSPDHESCIVKTEDCARSIMHSGPIEELLREFYKQQMESK